MSRVRRTTRALLGLSQLHPVWLGVMRVKDGRADGQADRRTAGRHGGPEVGQQIDLLPSLPAYPHTHLPVLDERARGTTFTELPVRSVLNTPASTRMGFWS